MVATEREAEASQAGRLVAHGFRLNDTSASLYFISGRCMQYSIRKGSFAIGQIIQRTSSFDM